MVWSVGDDITAGRLNAWTSSTDVTAVTGTNWDGTSPIIEYIGRASVVVGASAIFNVNLPAAFAHGLLYASLSPANNAGSLGFVVPVVAGHTLSKLQGGAFSQSASGIASSTTIVVNYHAIGW